MNRLLTLRAAFTGALMLLLLALCPRLYAYDLTVAKDGTGNYTTVQAGIDAAPAGRAVENEVDVHSLAPGIYNLRLDVAGMPIMRKVVVE